MKKTYLDVLMSIFTPIPSNDGFQLADNNGTADLILSNLFFLGYMLPVEGVMIGLFFYFLLSHTIEHKTQLMFREKFRLAINLLHHAHTPLVVLRNQLEEIVVSNLPEPAVMKLKQALKNADQIIDCNQSAISLDKANWKTMPIASVVEFELNTYIQSIVGLCHFHANSRHVQLKVSGCSDYVSCKINETVMTVALQHLLDKMIDITPANGCINIILSHSAGSWELRISNCEKIRNGISKMFPVIPAISSIYSYGDLWTVKKIIRLHGGKIIGYGYGKLVTYQVIIPKDCTSQNETSTGMEFSVKKQKVYLNENASIEKEGEYVDKKDARSCILLVMADKKYSDYLKVALSSYFKCIVLDNPDKVVNTSIQNNPDAIIIDETVRGSYGEDLCSRIKADKTIANIPVVLLIKATDNESYLSHAGSKADRLELRTANICRFRTDISMLIDNYMVRLERMKRFVADTIAPTLPLKMRKDDASQKFINKVLQLLEQNLAKESYTVDILSEDMGMSRTAFYNKMKNVTGQSPTDYMAAFKMERAKKLLASQVYTIGEIATMLGFCDSRYFAKKFKEAFGICPSKYIETVIG